LRDIVHQIREHFELLQNRYTTFAKQGVQLEGWLKGEILVALDRLYERQVIKGFDREVPFATGSKRKIDLTVDTFESRNWVELKYWLVGKQRPGVRYGPMFYTGDKSPVGIFKDVEKLRSIKAPGNLWLLILNVDNPGPQEWAAGLKRFVDKFGIPIKSCSNPAEYPPTYFLGLIQVPRS